MTNEFEEIRKEMWEKLLKPGTEVPTAEEMNNWRYETTDGVTEESNMTRVHFIHREQVIQVIEGENGRKGELSVITCDRDLFAHNVEKVVTRLAYTGANQAGVSDVQSGTDTPASGVWEGTS